MDYISAFLQALPAAASSPYALIAYAVAVIVAAYAGFRLRELQQVLRTLQARPSTSDTQMVEVIKVITQRPVPPEMTGAQWIRYQRLQAGLLIVIALIIASLTLAVVAMVKSPDEHRSGKISDIRISLGSAKYKVSKLANLLVRDTEFTVFFDSSVPDETRNKLVFIDTSINNIQLPTLLDMFCKLAGDLAWQFDPSTNIITIKAKGE